MFKLINKWTNTLRIQIPYPGTVYWFPMLADSLPIYHKTLKTSHDVMMSDRRSCERCFDVMCLLGSYPVHLIARQWVGLQTLWWFRLFDLSFDEMVGA